MERKDKTKERKIKDTIEKNIPVLEKYVLDGKNHTLLLSRMNKTKQKFNLRYILIKFGH